MEEMTPYVDPNTNSIVCDGSEITANLFKHTAIPVPQGEKLATYLRLRPVNPSEDQPPCFKVLNSSTLMTIPPENSKKLLSHRDDKKALTQNYTFSKILDVSTSQERMYEECAYPMVKRFLHGDNCLLFVYGITSSGKSYTMQGDVNNPGIIPRALNTIFELIGGNIVPTPHLKPSRFNEVSWLTQNERDFEVELMSFIKEHAEKIAQEKKINPLESFRTQMSSLSGSQVDQNSTIDSQLALSTNCKYEVWLTFTEFYNENLIDLLGVTIENEKPPKLTLLQDANGNYFVKGIRQVFVTSAEDAYKALLYGQNNLHISSTSLNKVSSRSHCAFNISLIKIEEDSERCLGVSNLSFCDLAGSERCHKTNNVGERLKEAGKINSSLLALGRCIASIRHNQKFKSRPHPVPFRESKLTKVFQPFFTGNGIANMIANINPSPSVFDETIVALNFSAVASQLVVNNEEMKRKLHDSLKRLTQVWMQSTQRWSSFSQINHVPKPSFAHSIVVPINEEDEESDAEQEFDGNMTAVELEEKVKQLANMDFDHVDSRELEVFRDQVEFLTEKIAQLENEKLDMEIDLRTQFTTEMQKITVDMEKLSEDKDKAKRRMEENMEKELKNLKRIHKEDKGKFENRISHLENELWLEKEKICEKDCEIEKLNSDLSEKDKEIERMINKLDELKKKNKELEEKYVEVNSELKSKNETISELEKSVSSIATQVKSTNTSMINNICDANTSTLPVTMVDHETSHVEIKLEERSTDCFDLMTTHDVAINTSIVQSHDQQTFVEMKLPVMKDQETWMDDVMQHVEKSDKEVSACIITCDQSILTEPMQEKAQTIDQSTSPHAKSIRTDNDYDKVEKDLKMHEELVKIKNYELEKVKDELKALKEENSSFKDTFEKNIQSQYLMKIKHESACNSKPSSIASVSSLSTVASLCSSISAKMEDNQRNREKPKYSSARKRTKDLGDSTDQVYFEKIKDKQSEADPSSQSTVHSETSDTTLEKDIISDCFTEKKRPKRNAKKRNQDTYEFEAFYKPRDSKRKKPPTLNMSSNSISPISDNEEKAPKRTTRSRAKKALF